MRGLCQRDGACAVIEALAAHCAANLARYKVPAAIHLVEALPRTSANKPDRHALRARAPGRLQGEVEGGNLGHSLARAGDTNNDGTATSAAKGDWGRVYVTST